VREFGGDAVLTDRTPPAPRGDHEIPYLICKDCGTPCYIFEVEQGEVREALCVTCGNETVAQFIVGDWDDVEG
jgi:hypothetical protein